ncbi:hypothetical protein [Klebsiella pneumoniae]|uniref:hypothetical protein n=1 Tax=Klebsiella pneumoniae TaxID=573 RepID=UPI0007CD2C1B|nr:hypothetical protein [Klebsiella pneumoniae]SAT62139.1 Uncharacterised protein [Klebsiella pneumoniae]
MTITLQAVNELIAALESAGELSIREQKFLKLAKAFKQLAAENVALKAEQVRIFNSGYLRGHDSTVEGYYVDIHQDDITTYHEDIVAEISQEQTPVTDRFVAGIKADGVEMFVEKCREKSMSAISSDIRNNWWLAGEHANDLAKQLREGADK